MDQSNTGIVFADTPEAAITYNNKVTPACLDDIMICALKRNAAIVDALLLDILERESFALPIDTVRNLLWLLQGQFAEMLMIMREYRKQ